ncbi:hypothetical protein [Bacillus pinisoli]|uniref:hypothetical protein n=1 Tax=Bacillus pinisoli TaxID=2901866 RepID=UPI001FF158F9|nr:hypothetical protein [Bacillus pinisoli]
MEIEGLKPLEEWICDVCGDIIKSTNDWLEWETNNITDKDENFRLVHHTCKRTNDTNTLLKDLYIHRVLGNNGLAKLLNTLETLNPNNVSDFTEIIRRLHLPYYEEARQFLEEARINGEYFSTELTEEDCKYIIDEYSKAFL